LADLRDGADPVEREPHDAALLGERLEDGLADPPDGVGDELEPARLVEPLRRLDQPVVPLVDDVGQREPLALVLLRDGDDEAEVGADELVEGRRVALFDPAGELDLLLGLEQGDLPNLLEVLVQHALLAGDVHRSRCGGWGSGAGRERTAQHARSGRRFRALLQLQRTGKYPNRGGAFTFSSPMYPRATPAGSGRRCRLHIGSAVVASEPRPSSPRLPVYPADPFVRDCRRRVLDCRRGAHVMGVLNVTPDSYSDGGRYATVDAALRRAEVMAGEGAAVIDVGGESTRPSGRAYGAGAAPVSAEEEVRRVVPVVEAIARRLPHVLISVDTYKGEVARAALRAGAHIVNDVTGLREGVGTARAAAAYGAPLVVMHALGRPGAMPHEHRYEDVVEERSEEHT